MTSQEQSDGHAVVVEARLPRAPRERLHRLAHRRRLRSAEGAALVISDMTVTYRPPHARAGDGWTLTRGPQPGQLDHVVHLEGDFAIAPGPHGSTFAVDGYAFRDRMGRGLAWLPAATAVRDRNSVGQRFPPWVVRDAMARAGVPWHVARALGHKALNRVCAGAVPRCWVAFTWLLTGLNLAIALFLVALMTQGSHTSPVVVDVLVAVFAFVFGSLGVGLSPPALDLIDRRLHAAARRTGAETARR
ncbi:hypothetical protein GXB85_14165 [Cellulomonas sp. APG4]|uniref:hypothetical protein n=1 Tax=Cellulomonas sp. APG4 TaxID=1538656 RepID=UPI0013795FD4|nr:hypothetical protein [Cellulomonas sp. APG4]NCT92089.1 hypothetical protein [Cellulomonas sp. APG4]